MRRADTFLHKYLGEGRSRRTKPPRHNLAGGRSGRDPELLHVTHEKWGVPKAAPESQEAKGASEGLLGSFVCLFLLAETLAHSRCSIEGSQDRRGWGM